jgi:hypothetical protein
MQHGSILPALHVPTDPAHRAERVLDRIGRRQGAGQLRAESQLEHGEHFLHAIAKAGRSVIVAIPSSQETSVRSSLRAISALVLEVGLAQNPIHVDLTALA